MFFLKQQAIQNHATTMQHQTLSTTIHVPRRCIAEAHSRVITPVRMRNFVGQSSSWLASCHPMSTLPCPGIFDSFRDILDYFFNGCSSISSVLVMAYIYTG
jgi:hypothetical protein